MSARLQLWNVTINAKFKGQDWNLNLTTSEQSMLAMLRAGWPAFEAQIKAVAEARPGERPAGLVDDALVLLRCLVFNRLEEHKGQHVHMVRV